MKFGSQRFGSALLACRVVQKRMTSRNMACWFRSRRCSCRMMSRFQPSGLLRAAAAMATCFARKRSSEDGLQAAAAPLRLVQPPLISLLRCLVCLFPPFQSFSWLPSTWAGPVGKSQPRPIRARCQPSLYVGEETAGLLSFEQTQLSFVMTSRPW